MADWPTVSIKMPPDLKKLFEAAADKLKMYGKSNLSEFLRQAGIDKANKVLGIKPTKDKH
jgi:uncharacterized protein (DUF1778 family)